MQTKAMTSSIDQPRQAAQSAHDAVAERWCDRLALIALAAVTAVALYTFKDYGLGWDDYTHTEYADLLIKLFTSGFKDRRAFEFVNLYLYGGGFDVAAALLHKILPFDLFETRRLLGAIVGIIGLAVTWRIGRRIAGPVGGLATLLILVACPSYYGHMFMNPKDVPFAVAMAVMLLGVVRLFEEFPHPAPRTLVLIGLGTGLAIGQRILGGFGVVFAAIAFLPMLGAKLKTYGLRETTLRILRVGYALIPAALLAILVMGLLWPWSVTEPLNIFRAVEYFSTFFEKPWRELFNGVLISVPDMPWTYLPTLFALHMPEMMVALTLTGATGAAWLQIRHTVDARRKSILLLILLAAAFPILLAAIKRPALYNGIRHFLFIVPPMALLSGLAVSWIYEALRRHGRVAVMAGALVFAAGLTLPIVEMVRLHPYQYTYFNTFAGSVRGAASRFMLDYWGLAFKQASNDLIAYIDTHKLAPPDGRKWNVAVCGPQRPAEVALGTAFSTGWSTAGADFAMTLGEFYCRKLNAPVIVEIKRDDVVYARVYDIRGRSISTLLSTPAP